MRSLQIFPLDQKKKNAPRPLLIPASLSQRVVRRRRRHSLFTSKDLKEVYRHVLLAVPRICRLKLLASRSSFSIRDFDVVGRALFVGRGVI